MGLSNVEDILQNILDGTTEYKKPYSRVEILLVQIKDLIATLQSAVNLKGETTTPLTDNATTNPIMIDGQSYTAVMNDAVIYQSGEFIFDGTKWHELGDLSNLTAANIGAMTGYSKPSETSAIDIADTLNAAIGKLEKALDLKQSVIDSDHKLSADNVDDANSTKKFATAAQLDQINTNKNNILTEQGKTTGMSEGGSNYITVGGMRLYMGDTEPTGTIPVNSTWIYGSSVKSYQGGVGDNKFDEVYPDISSDIKYRAIYVGDGTYTLSSTVGRTSDPAAVLFFIAGNVSTGASSSGNGVWEGQHRTVTAVDGYVTIAYREMSGIMPVNANTMLNTGSSVDTYEPYEYGWV